MAIIKNFIKKGVWKKMWYPYTLIALFLLILLFMPKRLTLREIYFSLGILGFGTWLGDVLVGDVFKAFQLGPSSKTYIIDYLFVTIIPPAIGLIYLNFLIHNKSVLYQWLWVVLSFLLEYGAVYFGYMKNIGWKTWYSLPVFILVFIVFLPLHLKILRPEKQ